MQMYKNEFQTVKDEILLIAKEGILTYPELFQTVKDEILLLV